VVAVHLVGGIVGSLCVGLFATLDTNPLGADGLFYGGGLSLLGKQALAVVCVMSYSFTVSFILGKVINIFIKNRVREDQEVEGLDLALHGETAYEFSTLVTGSGFPGTAPTGAAASPSAPTKEGVSA
jgi:Amt family ammonium transporter